MIPIYEIERLHFLHDAMLGEMYAPSGELVCLTGELPWKHNEPFISCIPHGLYEAIKVVSPRRGIELFQLVDVPDRSTIQLHILNAPSRPIDEQGHTESLGCIGPGGSYGMIAGYNAVLGSRKAFAHFMKMCENTDTILLRITNCF